MCNINSSIIFFSTHQVFLAFTVLFLGWSIDLLEKY